MSACVSSLADDGGADLADDDAGGRVGEPRRSSEARAGGERRAQHRDDRVAGARHVIDFARFGGERGGSRRSLDQQHALLAAGDEHRPEVVWRDEHPRRLDDLFVSLPTGRLGRGGEFAAVRLDHAGAAIDAVVVALGIDDHGGPRPRAASMISARAPLASTPLA